MRKLFWTVIFAIVILVLTAMAFYTPEELLPPVLTPETLALSDSLQHVGSAMQAKYIKMQEIQKLAITAGRGSEATDWMNKADDVFETVKNDYNTHIAPVYGILGRQGLDDVTKKAIDELYHRAEKTISADTKRETYLAKTMLGINVSRTEWNGLANELALRNDKFDRNMGLRNLADYISKFDEGLSASILNKMDSPFVKAMAEIKTVNINAVLEDVTEPYLQLELLIASGTNSLSNNVVLALKGLLNKFSDPAEKAHVAARIVKKLPGMNSSDRETFLTTIKSGGDALLYADCLAEMALSRKISDIDKASFITQIEEKLNEIKAHHPKEILLFKLLKLQRSKDAETLLAVAEEIESLTVKQRAYKFIICSHIDMDDEKFDELIEKLHDPYTVLECKLKRYRSLKLSGVDAVRYLEPLEAEASEIKVNGPIVALINEWGKIDPLNAVNRVRKITAMPNKVDAAVALTKIIKDSNADMAARLLEDVYIELFRAVQYEPVEKAPMVRKLAETMKSFDSDKAASWLKAICTPLLIVD